MWSEFNCVKIHRSNLALVCVRSLQVRNYQFTVNEKLKNIFVL